MSVEQNGGYDAGYKAVPCLWGLEPASLVRRFIAARGVEGLRVLDVGAGEGKNAAALVAQGAIVDAVECSAAAIHNGKCAFPEVAINWIHSDVSCAAMPKAYYDLVVSYGLTHCMSDAEAAMTLIQSTQSALKPGGEYILASFNDGSHDLSAHEGFSPLLLPHGWFSDLFEGWEMIAMSDEILYETHPHNGIPHHHSLTRIWARKPI